MNGWMLCFSGCLISTRMSWRSFVAIERPARRCHFAATDNAASAING